jgi:retron-type reverse transcriptase
VSQAFDKVWHPGLLYKLKKILPPYYLLLKSYLNERSYAVSSGSEISNISPILAGVPQGAVLSPKLYNLYIADQPTHSDTSVAEYADDKVIYFTHTDPTTVSTTRKIAFI